jgi:hypothetical protein
MGDGVGTAPVWAGELTLAMMTPVEGWTVRIPAHVREPFAVYVNGVPQVEGTDYARRGGALVFLRPLVKAEKLGFWRWFWGAFGIGTYGKDDQVDVTWEVDGSPRVAHALDIEPPS